MRKQIQTWKAIPLSFLFLLFFLTTQAQSYEWAITGGDYSTDEANSIVTDAEGNVYVTGSFRGDVDFDPSDGVHTKSSTSSVSDAFVEKFNHNGQLIWVKTFGGTSIDAGNGITIDTAGNLIIVGSFKKEVDFDPNEGVHSITSNGFSDIFVLKLTSEGDFIWVKSVGGSSLDEAESVTVDEAGNIYVTGLYRKVVDFDPGDAVLELPYAGGKDFFVQKLTIDGDFVWAKGFGSSGNEKALDIKVDAAGNVYTVGNFVNSVDFDPSDGESIRTSGGLDDVFIQKLDANGDFVWVSTVEGAGNNQGASIALNKNGEIFVTGLFNGTADFDPNLSATNTVTANDQDGFVEKLNSDGQLEWVKTIGGSSLDLVSAVCIDPNGNIFIGGSFSSSFLIDPTKSLISKGNADVFVARYDSTGDFLNAFSYGAIDADYCTELTITNDGALYTVGTFQNANVDFNPESASDIHVNNGGTDFFVQKMKYCIKADTPVFTVSSTQVCAGTAVDFEIISGNLNSAESWVWRKNECDGSVVGTGTSVSITPEDTTIYFVTSYSICDVAPSCVSFQVAVIPNDTITEEQTICEGGSYTFPDGVIQEDITTALSYNSTLSNQNGCDSIVITNLSVNPKLETSESIEVCAGESYTFPDGEVMENIQEEVVHESAFQSASTGCDSIVTTTVSAILVEAAITVSGSTLTATTQDADYQWFDCGTETEIDGATAVSFTPSVSGEYSVTVTQNGCSKTSACQEMIITGTKEAAWKKDIQVYPNPVLSTLNIDLGDSFTAGNMALLHITGKRIYSQELAGERKISIDMANLAQGVYYLQITQNGTPISIKIVK